jgi:hypothetical protein
MDELLDVRLKVNSAMDLMVDEVEHRVICAAGMNLSNYR